MAKCFFIWVECCNFAADFAAEGQRGGEFERNKQYKKDNE